MKGFDGSIWNRDGFRWHLMEPIWNFHAVPLKSVSSENPTKNSMTCMHACSTVGTPRSRGLPWWSRVLPFDFEFNFYFIVRLSLPWYPWKIPVLRVIPSCTGQSPLSSGITWHIFFFLSCFQNRIESQFTWWWCTLFFVCLSVLLIYVCFPHT